MKKFFFRPGRIFRLVLLVCCLAVGAYTALSLSSIHSNQARAAATCTPTGYMQDSSNLTAAMIVTASHNITNLTIDATGCNIGVYFAPGSSGSVTNADISGANYYGILNNSGKVTVTSSRIHNIGETPFNGDQHGVGIDFISNGSKPVGGSITKNQVSLYQKNGIVVRGQTSSAITVGNNTVTGRGPIPDIAQNGIEIGFSALATVTNNTVSGNSYKGSNDAASGGILVFGGACYSGLSSTPEVTTNTRISGNTLTGNDVGVFLSNLDSSCSPTTTPTRISVSNNTISNNSVNNTTGAEFNGQFYGYQAGISDQGDLDSMTNNKICGTGYMPVIPPPFLYVIDITNTNNPTVSNNTTCQAATSSVSQKAVSQSPRFTKHASIG